VAKHELARLLSISLPTGDPLLVSVGFMPNGVELVKNGLDLKASCPG
jgi:hypothetical protein